MFREERPYLQSLPRMPYDTRDVQVRVVSTDGYVMLDTNQYAVPDGLVGDRLYICAGTDRVEICDAMARRIIEHERLPHGAGITLPQHSSVQRRSKYDLDLLVERLGDWDPLAREYARLLRNHRRYPGPELTRILELQLRWSLDDLVAAMRHAMDYGRYELAALERILQRRFQPRPLDAQISVASRDAIARLMETHPVSQRPISGYDHLDHRDGQQMTTQEHDDAQEDHAP